MMAEKLHLNCFRSMSKSFTDLSCAKEESSAANGETTVIYEPSKPTLKTLATSTKKPLLQFASVEEQDHSAEMPRFSFRKRNHFVRQTSDFVSCSSQRITSWFSPRKKSPLKPSHSNQSSECILVSPPMSRAGTTNERRHSKSLRIPRKSRREINAYDVVTRIPDVIISCHGDYCYLRGSLPNVSDDGTVAHRDRVRRESSSSIDSEEDARLRCPARTRRLAIAETRNYDDLSPAVQSPASYSDEEDERNEHETASIGSKAPDRRRKMLRRHKPLNASLNSIDTVLSAFGANARNALSHSRARMQEGSHTNCGTPVARPDAGPLKTQRCEFRLDGRGQKLGLLKQPHAASNAALSLLPDAQNAHAHAHTKTNDCATPSNCAAGNGNGNGNGSADAKPRRILRKMITEAEISPCSNATCKRPNRQAMKSKSVVKSPLQEALGAIKPSFFKDLKLANYKDKHWTTLLQDNLSDHTSQDAGSGPASSMQSHTQLSELSPQEASNLISPTSTFSILSVFKITEQERRRREAVWELFVSELVFLVDHLMVLKHAYIEPLKKLQVDGFLMFAEPHELFGNADELCYVSYTFCRDFMSLLKESTCDQFGPTQVVVEALNGWIQHSRDGEVYHDYCLNYYSAINYLEEMRRHEDFCEYEKWCQSDERCRRLQLTDLLAAPMQHCTKIPLLIGNLIKYTQDAQEKTELLAIMQKIQSSLQQLDEKIKRLFNFDRLRQLQQQVHWPTVMEMNPSCYIPNKLKEGLSLQPCVELLASPKRTLLKEGPVSMIENDKKLDLYIFLFDDVLLLTKCKKKPPKKSALSLHKSPTDGWEFKVCKQPIPLDRVCIMDIEKPENGLEKHAWVVIHTTRFRQIIGAYTLQAANDATKLAWISFIQDAQNVLLQRLTIDITNSGATGNAQTNAADLTASKSMSRSTLLTKQAACSVESSCSGAFSDSPLAHEAPYGSCMQVGSPNPTVQEDCMLPKKEARRNAIDLSSVRANLLDSPDASRPQCLDLPKRSNFPYRTVIFPTVACQSSSLSNTAASATPDTAAVTATRFTRFCFTPGKSPSVINSTDRSPMIDLPTGESHQDVPNCAESCAFKPLTTSILPASLRELDQAHGLQSQLYALNTIQSPLIAMREACARLTDSNATSSHHTYPARHEDCRGSQSAVLPKKKISLGESSSPSSAITARFRKLSRPHGPSFLTESHAMPDSTQRLNDSHIFTPRLIVRNARMHNIRSSTVGEESRERFDSNDTEDND